MDREAGWKLVIENRLLLRVVRQPLSDGHITLGEDGRCDDASGLRDCLPGEWDGRIFGRIDTLLRWSGKRWSEMGCNELVGYASRAGYRKRWKSICNAAGITYLRAHEAGRHGFGTELVVRQKLDPVTVAKFGRWKSPQLLLDTYGHAEEQEVSIRERFRTNSVQSETSDPVIPMKKKGKF